MAIERRRFLQQAGLTLLTLGMSQTNFRQIDRYGQTLAAPGQRKLALLVGINNYQAYTTLDGCLTDVELQRELLVQRFNFQDADILTLSDTQATRENIETAFTEHLIKQAKPQDVIVFHFSGYGSLVQNQQLTHSLIPVDSHLPNKGTPTANDLLETTLILLAQSLPTEKVTLVLDTSYRSAAKPLIGNWKVRSLPKPPSEKSNNSELAFQEKLQLSLSPGQNQQLLGLKKNQALILRAGKDDQVAVEQRWQDFSAGLFTYNLTQYLWEAIPPTNLFVSMKKTAANIAVARGIQQQPEVLNQINILPYYLPTSQAIGAQGYISAITSEHVEIKLLGLPDLVLAHYGVNSCLRMSQQTPYLQIRHREGWKCTAKLLGKNSPEDINLAVGQLLQEAIRVFPRNLKLTVALDSSLDRIERVDATSALLSIATIANVVNAGEQPADCLLSKTIPPVVEKQPNYALFTPGDVLISQTRNKANEAIKSVVSTLKPQLETILAAKLWRLTVNQASSQLRLSANLNIIIGNQSTKISQSTLGLETTDKNTKKSELLPQIPSGSEINLQITNQGNQDLYFILLGILPNYQAIALYHPSLSSQPSPWLIPAGTTRIVPNPEQSLTWNVLESAGISEILLISSSNPFTQTWKNLALNQQIVGEKEQLSQISEPLAIAKALLSDLHNSSQVNSDIVSHSDVYALDVQNWATLRFVYQVVSTS